MDVEDGFNAEDLFGGKKYGPSSDKKSLLHSNIAKKTTVSGFYENSKNLFLICKNTFIVNSKLLISLKFSTFLLISCNCCKQ